MMKTRLPPSGQGPAIDLSMLEVTVSPRDGAEVENPPLILHVYELNRTRPTLSIPGESIQQLQEMVDRFVAAGGVWVDLVFHPMHVIGKFVIQRSEDEW